MGFGLGFGLGFQIQKPAGLGGAEPFYTDFSEDTIGELPAGMSLVYNETPNNNDVQVVSGSSSFNPGSVTGGKILRFNVGNSAGVQILGLKVDSFDEVQDAQIHTKFELDFSIHRLWFMIRASGTDTNLNLQGARYNNSDGMLEEVAYVNNTFVQGAEYNDAKAHRVWIEKKVQFQGEAVRGKIWFSDSETEPEDWQLNTTQQNGLTGNWVGIFNNDDAGVNIDWIEVIPL